VIVVVIVIVVADRVLAAPWTHNKPWIAIVVPSQNVRPYRRQHMCNDKNVDLKENEKKKAVRGGDGGEEEGRWVRGCTTRGK